MAITPTTTHGVFEPDFLSAKSALGSGGAAAFGSLGSFESGGIFMAAHLSANQARSASAAVTWCRAISLRQPSAKSVLSSRSEEHTSELQSQSNLVCRLLLEKKKTDKNS